MHILSADQFDAAQLKAIFTRADYFKKQDSSVAARRKLADSHKGRQLCSIFFQPSTRTRLSFETAGVKLGMGLISTENAREASSSTKGETLEDTIKILNGYNYNVIVIRHYEVGAAKRAAAVSSTPVINAGDGKGEHPTQSVLDAYTIHNNHGRLDNLHVVIGGDLKYGRTVRSLSRILANYKNNRITFVSVPQLQISGDVKTMLAKNKVSFSETDNVAKALKDADVVYWTRLQTENLENPESVKTGGFTLDNQIIKKMPKHATIMHPLPRVDEIHPEVDANPRAKYFEQASNGLYVRMALIESVLY